ncbi:ATPase F0F1 [Neobacillus mesonae]|nr:ATPase F0F1 [Neobacillus mesonae]
MNQDKPWLIALSIGGSGILLAAYITIGFFAGRWLMNLMNGQAYFIAIGCMVGLVLGVLNIAIFIKKFLGEQND